MSKVGRCFRVAMFGAVFGLCVGVFGAVGSAEASQCFLVLQCPGSSGPPAPANWPGYLFGPDHSSLNTATGAITPSSASKLAAAWSFNPPGHAGRVGPTLYGSPVVFNGSVYIGTFDGYFYELDEATGAIEHSIDLGAVNQGSCGTTPQGGAATAAVAPDPSRGASAATVYITGYNGTLQSATPGGGIYLWALDAATLKPVWATDPVPVDTHAGAFPWSSPTVSGGTVAVGIASNCDVPLVRGGVAVFNQPNGALLGTWYDVPAGVVGGGVWSTAAMSGTDAWVTTGNADQYDPSAPCGDTDSVVHLVGTSKVDSWMVPGECNTNLDEDFGASPTLFQDSIGTAMVGACSKNGTFYALRASSLASGPVWSDQVGVATNNDDGIGCLSAAVWDAAGHQLIIGGDQTKNGLLWNAGSISALSPDAAPAHRVLWEMNLPCEVLGTPSENAAGVLAVASFPVCSGTPSPTPKLYLFNARKTSANPPGTPTPSMLTTLPLNAGGFGQPTFADQYLFVPALNVLTAYR